MRLFKREPKNTEPESVIPAVEEKDLRTALVEALSAGSTDAKMLEIKTSDEDEIVVLADSGNIKFACSKKMPLRFSERLFWVDDEELPPNKRVLLADSDINFANPEFYSEVMDKAPEAKEVVDQIFREYTISVMLKANNSKVTHTFTEVLVDRSAAIVKNIDFFEKSVDDLIELVEKVKEDEITLLKGFDSRQNESITISLNADRKFVPATDVESLLHSAAEVNSSISDLREASSGFVFADILKNLSHLSQNKLVEVETVFYEEEEPLPDFADEDHSESEEEAEETVDSELDDVLEGISDDVVEEEDEDDFTFEYPPTAAEREDTQDDAFWEEYSNDEDNEIPVEAAEPVSEISEDDGGFEYEESDGEEEVEGMTGHLNTPTFEKDFERVLTDDVSDEVAIEISTLLEDNHNLEIKVRKVEGELAPLGVKYEEQLASVHFGENEEEEKSRKVEAHDTFFELYELEEKRHTLNLSRREILDRLLILLSDLSSDYVQEMMNRVEEKKVGIAFVENIAFHDGSDESSAGTILEVPVEEEKPVEEEVVAEEEESTDVEAPEEVVEHRVYEMSDVPMFAALVEQFGFNPLAELDEKFKN